MALERIVPHVFREIDPGAEPVPDPGHEPEIDPAAESVIDPAAEPVIDPAAEPDIRYQVPIKEWDESERPRERVMARGTGVLTDAELIGLIFRSGTRTRSGSVSAVQLGRTLLSTFGSLRDVSRRDVRELMRVVGIGPAKSVQLAAAFEIGRRIEAQPSDTDRIQVSSPEDVAGIYVPRLRDLPREVFDVIFLNTANVIIGDVRVSEGGLASSIVEPRAIFQKAVLENAAALICVHNHPSGNPEPSREDVRITRQLVEAGQLMGIPLHDHIIVAGNGYTSMAERQLM
ncbi:MAG: DNA repair protein RadC [Rhodothermales bacterium]